MSGQSCANFEFSWITGQRFINVAKIYPRGYPLVHLSAAGVLQDKCWAHKCQMLALFKTLHYLWPKGKILTVFMYFKLCLYLCEKVLLQCF